MNDDRYIYAQDRLDAAQRTVDQAVIAVRSLGYQTAALEDASTNLARWRRRLAADRAATTNRRRPTMAMPAATEVQGGDTTSSTRRQCTHEDEFIGRCTAWEGHPPDDRTGASHWRSEADAVRWANGVWPAPLLPANDHRQAVHVALRLVERAQDDLREARRVAVEFGLNYRPANLNDDADVHLELTRALQAVSVPWAALAIGPGPSWLDEHDIDRPA